MKSFETARKGQRHYTVIVSNVGQVYSGHNAKVATSVFVDYVALSKGTSSTGSSGRCYCEDVTILRDGEPMREFRHEDWKKADAKAKARKHRATNVSHGGTNGTASQMSHATKPRFVVDTDALGDERLAICTYTLAEVRDSAHWPVNARFIMIEEI